MKNQPSPWRFGSGRHDVLEPDEDWIDLAVELFDKCLHPLDLQQKRGLRGSIYSECNIYLTYQHDLLTAPRQKTVTKRLKEYSEASMRLAELVKQADHFTLLELRRSGIEEGPAFGGLKKIGFSELDMWHDREWEQSLIVAALQELARSAEKAADNQPKDLGGHGSLVPGNATWDLCVGCASILEEFDAEDRITGSVEGPFGTFVTYVLSAAQRKEVSAPENHIKKVAQRYRAALKADQEWKNSLEGLWAMKIHLIGRAEAPEENLKHGNLSSADEAQIRKRWKFYTDRLNAIENKLALY